MSLNCGINNSAFFVFLLISLIHSIRNELKNALTWKTSLQQQKSRSDRLDSHPKYCTYCSIFGIRLEASDDRVCLNKDEFHLHSNAYHYFVFCARCDYVKKFWGQLVHCLNTQLLQLRAGDHEKTLYFCIPDQYLKKHNLRVTRKTVEVSIEQNMICWRGRLNRRSPDLEKKHR